MNRKGTAFAGGAGDFDPAFVLLDDAIDGRQPQSGAFANFLGREEGLEDPIQNRLVHAATGVCHGQANHSARAGIRVPALSLWLGLAAASLLTVVLAPAESAAQAPAGTTGKIHGKVINPTGQPQGGGTVSLSTDGGVSLKFTFPVDDSGY